MANELSELLSPEEYVQRLNAGERNIPSLVQRGLYRWVPWQAWHDTFNHTAGGPTLGIYFS
jgi:hypothetical protein